MEIFDICDEQGNPTGKTIERSEAHAEGILHRTAHIWIVKKEDGRYKVLLQKRAMNKDSFPGRYDTSSAGHIQAGDEPRESAIRELGEELGIKAAPNDLDFAGKFRIQYEKEFHGKLFRDNEVAFVFVYRHPVDISDLKIQKEELDGVCWFDLEETYEACKAHDQKFCVPIGGLETVRHYLVEEERYLQRTSKFISLILRHKPETIGISLDKHGWADVGQLLEGISERQRIDMAMLEEIVRTDSKQRYSFNEDKTLIRANQGHSIPVDVELDEVCPPEKLWHGTGEKYARAIDKEGLQPKSRLYVHLSKDRETAFKVGQRHGTPVLYAVKSGEMYRDGYKFYLSKNGVWLTKEVPAKYLEKC